MTTWPVWSCLSFIRKDSRARRKLPSKPLVPLYRERAKNLIELADGIAQLLYKSADLPYDEAGVAKWLTDEGKEHVKVIRDQLAALPSFDKESIEHVYPFVRGKPRREVQDGRAACARGDHPC